jgi:hypothetical protein
MSQVEGTVISGEPGAAPPAGEQDVDIDSVVEKFLASAEESQKDSKDTEDKVPDKEETEDKKKADGEEAGKTGESKASESATEEEALWLKQKTDLERQLREANKKVKDLEEAETEEEEDTGPSDVEKAIMAELSRDPKGFFEKHGLTSKAGSIGKRLLGAALGDDAPEKFQKQLQELDTTARLEALEASIRSDTDSRKKAQDDAARQVRAEMLAGDLSDLLDGESLGEAYPYLAVITQDNRKEAENALEYEAIELVGAGGRWPSAKKVAQALEKKLVKNVSRFSKLGTAKEETSEEETQEETQGKERKTPKALSDKKGSQRKSKKDLKKEQESWDADQWASHAEKFVLENKDKFK